MRVIIELEFENLPSRVDVENYLKELSGKKSNGPKSNVNQMDGLMTFDNMGSSAYSSF